MLNINDKRAKELGIHLLKVGMTWPLENDKIRQFSNGLQELLIIEEKRRADLGTRSRRTRLCQRSGTYRK